MAALQYVSEPNVAEANPLKQGLKPYYPILYHYFIFVAEANPLKQGLKPTMFILSYHYIKVAEANPIKQGLKQRVPARSEAIPVLLQRLIQ